MKPRAVHYLLLIAAAFLFSTGGAAIKGTSLAGWQVSSFRSGVAAMTLFLFIPGARRGWNWRVIPVGAAYAATLILYVVANKLTTAANAIFLQYTAPLYLLLLGPFLLREPIRRSDLVFVSVMALGMAFFFVGKEHAVASAPDPARGDLLGALSGFTWACTVAGLRWLGKQSVKYDAQLATVVMGNLIACLICMPMAFPVGRLQATELLVILYLGIFQISLSYICLTRAIRHIPALTAATILLVEPALNPTWAWVFEGERPGAWAIAGGVLILATTFANTWWQNRRPSAVLSAAGSPDGPARIDA